MGSVAAIAYSLRQATQVPAWYGAQTSSSAASQVIPEVQEGAEVVLSAAQVDQLVQEAIARQPLPPQWQEPVANLSTTVEDGRLEAGTVVNLADLPLETLNQRERERVEQILSMVPGLDQRDLYIGLETRPQIQDGRVELDGNTMVRVGQLRMPLGAVAQQFGFSVDDLESSMMELLQQEGIALDQLRIEGDRIYLQPQR